MPLESIGLTGLCPTSKLFFAASQEAFLRVFNLCVSRQKMHRSFSVIKPLSRSSRLRVLCAVFAVLLNVVFCVFAPAQSAQEPVREKLLNGLTILFWQRPSDQNVMIKLRINSGAAFDLAGKDGLMALLTDAFFPDSTTREYVIDQPGGRLEVATTHDAIELTIAGKAGQFERMVELIRNAVTAQVSAEIVSRIRDEQLKRLSEKSLTISEIADREIAQRLFGRFPYAHTTEGTTQTIAKIDRGDLMLARERFLNADNAAIAIIGGVEKARAMRALRQLLGPWNKGDRTVPATFRQPDPPDTRVLVVNQSNATSAEIRIAVRGLARTDRDEPSTTSILTRIVRDRWRAASPELSSVSVRHEAHFLPGMFLMSATVPVTSASKTVASARQIIVALAQSGPAASEMEHARAEALAENYQLLSQTESLADAWLDTVTFKASSPNQSDDFLRSVRVSDVQRIATRLFKGAAVATVAVGNSQQLKAAFTDPVEVREAVSGDNATSNSVAPTKKP